MPDRIQLRRTKGFDLQALSLATNGLPAVKVARPGPFSNPFTIAGAAEVFDVRKESAHVRAVKWFEEWLDAPDELFGHGYVYEGMKERCDELLRRLPELRGKNLACFCDAKYACHVDSLLVRANAPICEAAYPEDESKQINQE